ncbi:hypothetical protein BOTBODRAFT_175859 [Botryobasidium botryosum FD-172 SS1]|uniref:Uncharacterized protein n=1 Tax=Botryobasidium botryosum (strain FD-172 SS1) TaxID=930990 RepID=A0A067MM73_BOTB1|nr:hypothetical protein BOTBODRAFT_175859 [Botryobasidium botryosum FD-172 SS1]
MSAHRYNSRPESHNSPLGSQVPLPTGDPFDVTFSEGGDHPMFPNSTNHQLSTEEALITQRDWLRQVSRDITAYSDLIEGVSPQVLDPARPTLVRLFLCAVVATAMNRAQITNAIRDNSMLMSGPIATLIAEAKPPSSSSSSSDEAPDINEVFRNVTANQLSKIKDLMAHLESLAHKALTKDQGPSDKGKSKPKDTPGPSALGGPSPTQPAPAKAKKGENKTKFNPSPNKPSAYQKKVRDPLSQGELLFAPTKAITRDGNEATVDGINGLNLINGQLAKLTPTCSIKGLRWTQRSNVLLTPTNPEEWDILAKQGLIALEKVCGISFALRTPSPLKDLVLHGWPAKHGALPNTPTTLSWKNVTGWSAPSPTPAAPLLLFSVTTDGAKEKLFHNPHWVNGRRISFKKFQTPPTIPNQCSCCWKVGHPTWRCSIKTAICALCSGAHLIPEHACSTQGCKVKGAQCAHTILQCPICAQAHPAWDRDCQECQIQKAANPPKKKQAPPKAAGLVVPGAPVPMKSDVDRMEKQHAQNSA